jgi:osmotically-inducible protein OsmY
MSRITSFLFGGAVGAAAVYFLDPEQGARRRSIAIDKSRSYARQGADEAQRKATYAEGVARGAAHPGDDTQPGELDDVTLTRKVESEIFRGADAPKGQVDVNAEDGVVYLRGELDAPAQIEALAGAAARVPGVRAVKNLLHAPGEDAPTKEEAPPVESS